MNPQQEEYSIDYLNQISTAPKKQLIDKKMIFIIIVAVSAVILLLVTVLSVGRGESSNYVKLQTLSARINTLGIVTNDAKKNIKGSALNTTNTSLNLFLTDASRDIENPLAKAGGGKAKIEKNIETKYNGEELKQTLEDARLNGVYDRTYIREISYELETLSALMSTIYKSTNSKSLKEFLETTDSNLLTIRNQLDEFNDSSS